MCVYCVDRALGKLYVAEALRGAGARAEVHDDHFEQARLAEIGRRGWVVLTKDNRIAYRRLERLAVAEANVQMFALVAGDLSGEQMAATFAKALNAMQRFALEHDPPFIAKVYRDGSVKAWKTGEDLRG